MNTYEVECNRRWSKLKGRKGEVLGCYHKPRTNIVHQSLLHNRREIGSGEFHHIFVATVGMLAEPIRLRSS